MNKKSKIIVALAAVAIIVIAFTASIYYLNGNKNSANPLLPAGNPPAAQLKITGDIATEKTLSISDLAQMPLTTVTHIIKGETATYIGVTVMQLLDETEASWDVGFINVIAGDGFKRTINTYQAFNSTQYSGSEFILAFVKNGRWITDSAEGPLKLIAPSLESNYNVKSVAEINLKPWTIIVNGTVSNPLVLTGGNITKYDVKTVNAAFAPGGEPQRTSDWTGVTLQSILQASGISSGATKITFTAIDGYSRDFTLAQVQSTGMLIGYQENGAYLSTHDGAPFRLFVPTEEFKWGQNWVRWVAEITVS